jgi:sterol 3beta-glucosyltransferase
MLITILAAGSRGDLQPYIALGTELKKAGHNVRIATFEKDVAFIKSFGLEFYKVKGDISAVASGEGTKGAREADNPLKLLLSFNKLKSLAFDMQKDFFNACAGSDAIVYHPGAAIGYFAARHFNVPSILATPFPMTPTGDYPALIFYNLPRLGRGYNLLTHKIFEKIMWSASGANVKKFWKEEFGKSPEGFTCPFGMQTTRFLPTVISCSNYVFPRPSDWPEHVYNTGYWFLDEEADWRPSSELMEFIGRGKPPVYVGFGSIANHALAMQTTDLVIEALKRSGQRGILATGWGGMTKMDSIPEDTFILESAPHSWLFPQMAAVVHHGGAGTTAAGLRAGVPGIIIPFSNDQFAWGRRAYELGVASKPIPGKILTAEKLADAIKFVLTKEIKDASKDLGTKIQSENGASAAAKIIINCVGQKGF